MTASRLGFGTYRWSGTDAETAALRYALERGCRLLDTAPNYSAPELRECLGRALTGYREEVFVISKAGYRAGGHSLDPLFLRERMDSEARLVGHGHLDGFLLHNPEHLLPTIGRVELLQTITRAFEFCEDRVRAGTIRWYGISSNVIAQPDHPFGQATVDELLAIAAAIDTRHHFRLLQFPFNLGERAALANGWARHCQQRGLITIGNRPLSVLTPDGPVRIADPPGRPARPSADILAEFGDAARELWARAHSSDALDCLIDTLARAGVATADLADLISATRTELRATAARRCTRLVDDATREAILPGPATDPIALRACRSYLDELDQVLVGMRTVSDVAMLAELFTPAPASAAFRRADTADGLRLDRRPAHGAGAAAARRSRSVTANSSVRVS